MQKLTISFPWNYRRLLELPYQVRLLRPALLWLVFFLSALSLGYPTLNRYDPTTSPLADTQYYAEMVRGDSASLSGGHWRYRILTPLLAKPVYLLVHGQTGSWDPVFFALLVVNAVFCASTALLLTFFGRRFLGDTRAGLLAGFLYLTNFNVSNLYLSGLVDASEVFFMVVLAGLLFDRRWWSLPMIGIVGALAKETFVPFSGALFAGWYLAERWYQGRRILPVVSGAAMIGLGLATVTLVRFLVSGHPEMPWETASSEIPSLARIVTELPETLLNRNVLYTFAILGPLGALGLRRVPIGWVIGSGTALLVAIILSAGGSAGDNIGRPLFSAIGPMLTISAASFLWTWIRPDSNSR